MLAAAFFCAACLDGYPDDDAPDVSPFDLTQAQRIEALNARGEQGQGRTPVPAAAAGERAAVAACG